ncbi:MAG: peptide-methionine (S)-S-oxide reductase MsrA [Bacteroidales bacterium]|nr:peptide-methionine (S)-S-oxide reductase MsrA [Bacteroidales bacterium]
MYRIIIVIALTALTLSGVALSNNKTKSNMERATFGAGCFWCTEAIFERVKGVETVTSGYSGGDIVNPSYKEVSSGTTGHAEVVQLEFDPEVVSYEELLEIYWKTHDPTQLNRQGADVGPQYRSVIFYHNEKQKELAESYKEKLQEAGIWDKPIVTAIEPFKNFFEAENYHQDYYENNKSQGYCQFVITPKLEKFKKVFQDKLKNGRKE